MIFRKKIIRNRAFTFMEIMFVVVIIGVLLGLVGPRLIGKSKRAKISACEAQIKNFKTALNTYEMHIGEFPTTSQGLKALIEKPSEVDEEDWQGPYMESIPKDPWTREYQYKSPGEHSQEFDLFSFGPDRQEGTDDDIVSWQKEAKE